MTNRFFGLVTIALLLLATAFVAEPYLVAWRFSATAPRAIAPRADLTETERTTIKIFQAVSPSVVYVYAQASPQNFFSLGPEQTLVSTGTGIVWDAAGHVVTNYHIIKGSDEFGALLPSGQSVAARVVASSPDYDLAVLQLERPPVPLHPIALGSSADLQVGQAAFAIGNPYGLEQTLTSGIVSALHRRIPTDSGHEIAGAIQTDAPLNPGNSGGPLLDSSGRLIGVTSAIVSRSGASAGIGIAIPVDIVNRVAADLIRQGHVAIPGIGIAAATETAAARLGLEGVVIVKVQPGSPAAKAGLEGVAPESGKVEDVITAVDGQPVRDIAELAGVFEQIGVGKKVTLTVLRDDRSRSVEVTLADVSRYQN